MEKMAENIEKMAEKILKIYFPLVSLLKFKNIS